MNSEQHSLSELMGFEDRGRGTEGGGASLGWEWTDEEKKKFLTQDDLWTSVHLKRSCTPVSVVPIAATSTANFLSP